jgi:hypothetical protein
VSRAEAEQRPGVEREAGPEGEPGAELKPEVSGELEPGTGEQRAEKVIEAIAAQRATMPATHCNNEPDQTVSSTVIQSETN